jgi:hypothetical protein
LIVENKKLFFLSARPTELGFAANEPLIDCCFGETFRNGEDSGDKCLTGDLVEPSSRVDRSMVPFLERMIIEPAQSALPSREVLPCRNTAAPRGASFSGGVGSRKVSLLRSSLRSLHCL